MTAAVTPPGYCGYCTVPRQGSHSGVFFLPTTHPRSPSCGSFLPGWPPRCALLLFLLFCGFNFVWRGPAHLKCQLKLLASVVHCRCDYIHSTCIKAIRIFVLGASPKVAPTGGGLRGVGVVGFVCGLGDFACGLRFVCGLWGEFACGSGGFVCDLLAFRLRLGGGFVCG
jgi:hypothetical protein